MTFNSANGRRNLRRHAIALCALGLALALGPTGAALADTTVTTATTTPLVTSTAGNVTINSGGSITVTAGQTAVTVDSDNSLLNTGAINALLAGGIGVDVTAQTTFGIVNGGTIKTGTAQVLDSTGAVTTAAILGGPAIQVSQDLGAGISNSISITTVGANAVLIQTDSGTPANITLGVVNSGVPAQNYGIYNNGSISSTGGGSGDGTATVLIAGDATHTTTITNGINNASSISGSAIDADATAISIGQGGIVDTIANTGSIGATTAANTIPSGPPAVGGTAVAINIDAQGSLPSITNAGTATIFATASAAGTNATAILDQSGTLLSVTNNGTIEAFAGTTASPGTAVALNLSSASGNETVANNGGVIIGNILLGSGNDTITQTLNNPAIGAISGTIDMGLGTNSFTMSSGSMSGAIRSSGGTDTITLSGSSIMNATSAVPVGTLDLIVNDATFRAASGGTFNATTAEFNDSSTLAVTYDPTGAVTSGKLITSGVTTFDASALATAPKVSVVFTSYLAAPASIDLVQASGFTYSGVLTGAGDLLIGGVGVGYNAALVDSGTVLTLDLTRKTAGDLGYTGALAAIYTAAADPLALDTTGFGAAVGNIGSTGTQAAALATLKSLYTQLLPDISGAREETAIRVQDIASGFISDRLNLLRTADQGVGDGGGEYDGYRHRDAGFWAQESVSNEDGKGGSDSQSYNGTMYVFSIGYDKRGADSDVWGASINYAALTYNTPFSQSDNVAQNVMGQLYYSMNQGPLFWDSMGGLGWNNYDLHRTVNLSPFSRSTSASWTGYQGGLASQVGYAAMLGPVSIRPSVGASYTILDQQAYTEKGGGTGVDLAVDSNTFQSLRANAEIRVSTILSADPQFVPYVRGGISHELLDAKPKADGNFVGGGPASAFSIEGDPLNKDTPYVGIGLSAVGGFSHLTIEYTGMFGDRVTSQQAAATVSMAF